MYTFFWTAKSKSDRTCNYAKDVKSSSIAFSEDDLHTRVHYDRSEGSATLLIHNITQAYAGRYEALVHDFNDLSLVFIPEITNTATMDVILGKSRVSDYW